ncbi:related to SAC2 protein [Serendipita indica DSM 11827]|uniref:Related to SAC2 protein n=1 Tax=Serendipita indica (strain DSM 11827) TaxID=1109443 RepID=G4TPT1_SERID|nr:related to SAC2 protein [Serendipita indica DSM 11827]
MSSSTTRTDVSFYRTKTAEFVELHNQVEVSTHPIAKYTTSLALLQNLESFLSTFQHDLKSVAGQISELQQRSQDIDERLKERKKIEKPLGSLIADLTIPPELATLLLDTNVGEPWIEAVAQFEEKLDAIKSRGRVKASKDLGEVAQALGIVIGTKLRSFFLALLQPIRTNMSTNMQVLQTSVLLKYKNLFKYLQRNHPTVAAELQRAYTGTARTYYETGFRRYIRSLTTIKGRSGEPFELVGSTSEKVETALNVAHLEYASLEGPAVTMAFMADDSKYKEPVEALFRSLMIVLMDNATAELSFIRQFFDREERSEAKSAASSSSVIAEDEAPEGTQASSVADHKRQGSAAGHRRTSSTSSMVSVRSAILRRQREEEAYFAGIWKQVMEPILQYTDAFLQSIVTPSLLDPKPSVVPILTMIRLNEAVYRETGRRSCPPLEGFLIGVRMKLWPLFQTEMGAHVESLKKLADAATGSMLVRGNVRDPVVRAAAQRYAILFSAIVALLDEDDEPMLFLNLSRLRQELTRLISVQAGKVRDQTQKAIYLSTTYEAILQTLSMVARPTVHPKMQTETAFWREREEEARRRIASTQG